MIAARLSPGAISESSSSHLPPSESSAPPKPVTFPPGRSSLGTMPLATGSAAFAETIGIVRVSRWTAAVAGVAPVRMMSGCRPTNSCASACVRLMSARPHRRSIRTLRPRVRASLRCHFGQWLDHSSAEAPIAAESLWAPELHGSGANEYPPMVCPSPGFSGPTRLRVTVRDKCSPSPLRSGSTRHRSSY
jgi:hypothetical protein